MAPGVGVAQRVGAPGRVEGEHVAVAPELHADDGHPGGGALAVLAEHGKGGAGVEGDGALLVGLGQSDDRLGVGAIADDPADGEPSAVDVEVLPVTRSTVAASSSPSAGSSTSSCGPTPAPTVCPALAAPPRRHPPRCGAPPPTVRKSRSDRRLEPASPALTRFVDDDDGYLAWRRAHPAGWVLNCERQPKSTYLKLHQVDGPHLQSRPGWSITTAFAKVCGTSPCPFDEWLTATLDTRPGRCPGCRS